MKVVVDVGVNVGDISLLARQYFQGAFIYGYEPIQEYYLIARKRLAHLQGCLLFQCAISSQHLFHDDHGVEARQRSSQMRSFKATSKAGPGWIGGSLVLPDDHAATKNIDPNFYCLEPTPVFTLCFDGMVAEILRHNQAAEIDVVKMDCEGGECSSLGAASEESLRKVRFIVGEYHNIERFFSIMKGNLFKTHRVNLIGDRALGAFFAERIDNNSDGILRQDKSGMLLHRPWLSKEMLEWHLFNPAYVLPNERGSHAL